MHKKYVVRLSEEERRVCQGIIKTLKGSSQKFRRAQILLKADADGAGWSDVHKTPCGRTLGTSTYASGASSWGG
jgi:hypothetical protein